MRYINSETSLGRTKYQIISGIHMLNHLFERRFYVK